MSAPPSPPTSNVFRPEPPDVSHLVTETEEPLDGFFQERQLRLLTETLYSAYAGHPPGEPFLAATNVGVYASAALDATAIVPTCSCRSA